MNIKSPLLKEWYLFALILILVILVVLIFAPFLNVIVASLILVEFFMPLYKKIAKILPNWAASIVTTVIVLLTVVIPLAIILTLAAAEAVSFGNRIGVFLQNAGIVDSTGTVSLEPIKPVLATLGINIEQISLRDVLIQAGAQTGQLIYGIVSAIVNNFANIVIRLFFMIFTMIYLFIDYERLGKGFKKISPLPDDLDEVFADKFRSTTRAVVKGTFVIALLQATSVAIPMWFMGIEPVVLWWVIMVIMSVIPVGSGVVWAPLGILMIIAGRPLEGLFIIVYSAIAINVIDTTLRPRLLKKDTNLHPVVALFSVLGGLNLFGIIGIIYGPLIAVFFLTIMEVYRARYHTAP
ncbi:MAG: AI-2E family transporter [Candidatus Dojkabacteria bacterium]|uniref:AI-2E family transporter n=2 Tax=Candidatus Dojkabacteria TaxID=74243 RepID=A0A952DU40_9BACT|nr:MAG: putative inner membrane protein [candidate division WS6 bacterium OLB21]MBW7953359.1 AI-2E family transporter [Candidatus Dojkabacteria bacterium]WKZ27565.1 MAG: AI-2E family transporter [Candidatus Dojkabacteria bacterium]